MSDEQEKRIAELEKQLEIEKIEKEQAMRTISMQGERISKLSIKIVEQNEKIELLEVHALEDPLTGLYNRRYVEMQAARFENATSNRWLCLIAVDINYLRDVNNKFGHEEGDNLLVLFTKKMAGLPGQNKTLARVGGDELLLIIVLETEDDAIHHGKNIQSQLNEGFNIKIAGRHLNCSAAVGYSIHALDGNFSFKTLWKIADLEMYANKIATR